MALEDAPQLAQAEVLHLRLKVASLIERRVVDRAGMTLGEDKPVAVFPVRVLRVDVHHIKKQGSDNIRNGQGRTGMSVLAFIDHPHGLKAELLSDLPELFVFHHEILPSHFLILHQTFNL